MRVSLIMVFAALVAGALLVRARPVPDSAAYLGSGNCVACHGAIHEAWSGSEHTKMMRPANQPGVVVADFASDDPSRRFELEDVVWAIGGKWEQQFMGHDGKGETLLPGAWLHLAGRWDFQEWDGWQVPVARLA